MDETSPEVMHAAFYRSFGDARDVLELGTVDRPVPGPGEVRVKISVSAVNPTDWKARRGSRPMQFPFVIPHQDGAGVIEEVGEGVNQSRIGQEVWVYFATAGRQFGTAAEYSVVPARRAVPLPEGVGFDLGACMGVPAITAHYALFSDGPIDGSTVLVAGGAGAVGHYAVELAKDAGARVISTVSGLEKAALAEAAGADVVVNYKEGDPAEAIRAAAPDGVDRIVEVAFGANAALDTAVLAPHGTMICYSKDAVDPVLNVLPLMFGNQNLRFMMLYDVGEEALGAAVSGITDALSRGALTELPFHRFKLEDTVAAQEAVEKHAVGKVLIDLP